MDNSDCSNNNNSDKQLPKESPGSLKKLTSRTTNLFDENKFLIEKSKKILEKLEMLKNKSHKSMDEK